MDAETLAVSLKMARKKVLPETTAGDAGAVLTVDSEGNWTKGEPITSTISVSENTLVVTSV